jgi:hypothetical protein
MIILFGIGGRNRWINKKIGRILFEPKEMVEEFII